MEQPSVAGVWAASDSGGAAVRTAKSACASLNVLEDGAWSLSTGPAF